MKNRHLMIVIVIVIAIAACSKNNNINQKTNSYSQVGTSVSIHSNLTENELKEKNAVFISNGKTNFYVGYQQVSSTNKNPVVMRFDDGNLTWVKSDYETSGDDGTAYGILWDGANDLYIAFSATGSQGDAEYDYRRFCTNGWLKRYGTGGGAKVSVILKINTKTGAATNGTFLYAIKSDGKTNSLVIKEMNFDNSKVLLSTNSWYSPLNIDKKPFSCSGSSPFAYKIAFNNTLNEALSATSENCN